jgi:hypothetical protein
MSASSMHITYFKHSMNTIKCHKTEKVNGTLVSITHGITPSGKFTFPCPATVRKPATVSTILAHIKPQHHPYFHAVRTYGAKQQFVETKDNSGLLNKTDKPFVQEVIGVFLYYA